MNQSFDSILQELNTIGLKQFMSKYNVISTRSTVEPNLVTINYIGNNRRNNISDFCRGLTLECVESARTKSAGIQSSYQVVARGLDRFDALQTTDILTVQSKEDGTMMMVYWYGGAWHVKCRYNFADDLLPYNTNRTYRQLFDSFGLDYRQLNKSYTYIFEMCSEGNRIVQKYAQPTLFLLTAVNIVSGQELSFITLNDLAEQLKVPRPRVYAFKSWQEIRDSFRSVDMLFEGYVVILGSMGSIRRIKIKNPLYLATHTVKYRGWITLQRSPDLLLKLEPYFDQLYIALHDMGFNDMELDEIRYLRELRGTDSRYHTADQKKYCDVNPLYEHVGQDLAYPPVQSIDWSVVCTCGYPMTRTKLRRDYVVPSFCHCGKRNGTYSLPNNSMVYICSDPTCRNTHEAIQPGAATGSAEYDAMVGAPRGIPCTKICKIFRLHVHWLMDRLIQNKKMNKRDVYAHLSKILGTPPNQTHVARFDIATCHHLICELTKFL